ncbi:MAG: hypothetical protein V4726_11165 [Verrucomicrobiota bacterium]
MKLSSILACLILPMTALHAGEKLAVLKLKDGTEYKTVEITGVNAKGLRILHNDGAANVAMDQLPDALRIKYEAAQKKAGADAATAEAEAKGKAEAEAKAKPVTAPAPAAAAPQAPAGNAPPMPAAAKGAPAAAPLPQIVTGKVYGLAEVMADLHKLDGKIVKVEVIPNTASKIESIGAGMYQIFVGDPFAKDDSDYVFMSFPEEGRRKIETLLRGKRGKMTFYMEVHPDGNPKIHAVGRSTSSGAPGKPITITW